MSAAADKSKNSADAAPPADEGKSADLKGGGGANAKGMGMGKGGMGKGGGGGDKKGGQRGPSSQAQLAQLVTKLDVLTAQSLHIALTTDEKKQVKEQLADLAEKDAVKDEEAKAKLDALLKLLEPHRATLEAAGYRWPGAGGGGGGGGGGMGGGSGPQNPFKEGEAAEHLRTLQTALEK
jgi:hypothetical protein